MNVAVLHVAVASSSIGIIRTKTTGSILLFFPLQEDPASGILFDGWSGELVLRVVVELAGVLRPTAW